MLYVGDVFYALGFLNGFKRFQGFHALGFFHRLSLRRHGNGRALHHRLHHEFRHCRGGRRCLKGHLCRGPGDCLQLIDVLAVAGVQIVLKAEDLLTDLLTNLFLDGSVGVCIRNDPFRIRVGFLQNLFLLLFRLVEKGGGGTAHFRVQTGNACLSGLQFRQLFQSNIQFLRQLDVFPVKGIHVVGQEVYVLIHLGGGVAAHSATKGMIADFLRQ